ncbi:hypothetical protein [Burkholderia multivorans]|uniref:hypothetical protein n=1 Tax=Burkholderia multivorans TaxID=87883 RepID=UPI001C229BD3|nr:hypothetical protein [Burkholderia multivorans]MBU9487328.1 hypothetical protein [Burkholderia multivorans]
MMALSDASEPPNCCWSDGSAIVALPTCSADTMLASTTLTTAARRRGRGRRRDRRFGHLRSPWWAVARIGVSVAGASEPAPIIQIEVHFK